MMDDYFCKFYEFGQRLMSVYIIKRVATFLFVILNVKYDDNQFTIAFYSSI